MDSKILNLKEKLKENGYKITAQRELILDAIAKYVGHHLNSEEIYNIVKEENPDIGIATVYRTLILLEDLNLIHKINLDDGCSRYEINRDEHEHGHHHLICNKCGKIDEAEDDLLEELEEQIYSIKGFKVTDHTVKFYGYCSECKDSE